MRQNRPNPPSVRSRSGRWKSLPSKTMAAKMNAFLVHWRGRMVFNNARIIFLLYMILGRWCYNPCMPKTRLDLLLVERGLAESRAKAQALILAGEVRVAGQVVDRASAAFP